jgi:hypothetical protein
MRQCELSILPAPLASGACCPAPARVARQTIMPRLPSAMAPPTTISHVTGSPRKMLRREPLNVKADLEHELGRFVLHRPHSHMRLRFGKRLGRR